MVRRVGGRAADRPRRSTAKNAVAPIAAMAAMTSGGTSRSSGPSGSLARDRPGQQPGRRRGGDDDEHHDPGHPQLGATLEPPGLHAGSPQRRRSPAATRRRDDRPDAPEARGGDRRAGRRAGADGGRRPSSVPPASPSTPASERGGHQLGDVEQAGRGRSPAGARSERDLASPAAHRVAGGGHHQRQGQQDADPGRHRGTSLGGGRQLVGVGGEVHDAGGDRRAQGQRALGQLGARGELAPQAATASAVRWNRPRRGVGSHQPGQGRPEQLVAGPPCATAAVVARSATARWARRVGSSASDGEGLDAEVGPEPLARRVWGVRPSALHGVGAEHPGGGDRRLGQPGQLHPHLVARGDTRSTGPPAREATRPRRPPAPARPRRPVRGPGRRRRTAAPGPVARVAADHRPDRVEEDAGVQLGGDRLRGDPGRPDAGDLLEGAQQVGPLAGLGVDAAVEPHHRRRLGGAPAGTESSARRTAASETASAYSGPAAAATASMVSTPSIRVRVTTSCSSRRGAKRHSGGGRQRRRARGGAPVGTSAARLDSTVTPRSVTHASRCVSHGTARPCPAGAPERRVSRSAASRRAASRSSLGKARTSPGTAHANMSARRASSAWSVTRAMRSQALHSLHAHPHVLPDRAALHAVELAGEVEEDPDRADRRRWRPERRREHVGVVVRP